MLRLGSTKYTKKKSQIIQIWLVSFFLGTTLFSCGTAIENEGIDQVKPDNTFVSGNEAPSLTTITFTGVAQEGQTLVANYTYFDQEGDLEGSTTFRWMFAANLGDQYSAIPNATNSTYIIANAYVGMYIKLEITPYAVTGTTNGNPVLSEQTTPPVIASGSNAPPTASPVTISGIAKEGETLTGNFSYNDNESDPPGVHTYQWYRANFASGPFTPLGGETAVTYVLTSNDVHKYIRFEITPLATSGALIGTPTLSPTIGPIAQLFVNTAPAASSVSVLGVTQQGQTLTAQYTYYDADTDAEGTSLYEWQRASSLGGPYAPIGGATAMTYVLQAGDVGKYIKFKVTPVAAAGTSPGTAVYSAATAQVVPPPEVNAAPTASDILIGGGYIVDGYLVNGIYAYADAENDAEENSTYRWLISIDNSNFSDTGITTSTYMIPLADVGKYLKFEVTPRAKVGTLVGVSYLSPSVLVGSSSGINVPPTANDVVVNGTPVEGNTLTGSFTYFDADGNTAGAHIYKWYRSPDNVTYTQIGGATAISYTLVTADVNNYIKFEATPVATAGTSPGSPVRSVATPLISGYVPPNTAPVATNVRVIGIAQEDQTIIGTYTYSDADNDAEGTTIYKWFESNDSGSSWTEMVSVTSIFLSLNSSHVSPTKRYKFQVTPNASAGEIEGVAVDSVIIGPIVGNGAPRAQYVHIEGTPRQGQLLSGLFIYEDDAGDPAGAHSYNWYTSTTPYGATTSVGTGVSYTLAAGDVGKYIRFAVRPGASVGTNPGAWVMSPPLGPIVNIGTNAAPYATSILVGGTPKAGETLNGNYTYNDVEGDTQGASTYRWLFSNEENGIYTPRGGATNTSYIVSGLDIGGYLRYEISPIATSGTLTGPVVLSKPIGVYYSHPITSFSEWNTVEEFVTTTSGYNGHISWDYSFIYVGLQGTNITANNVNTFMLVYINGSGTSTTTGKAYNTQTPTLPFSAQYLFAVRSDGNQSVVWDYATASNWTSSAGWFGSGNVTRDTGNNAFILKIPRADIGDPSTIKMHVSFVNQTGNLTTAGVPSTSFTDGADPNYTKYYEFNFNTAKPPAFGAGVIK